MVANGNDGVAQYIDFRHNPTHHAGNTIEWGRMGYVGPDYVLPAVLNTGANNYGLNTATLKNASGKFIAPTIKGALAAFGSATPPDSFPNGKYDSGSADPRDRANPQDWVEPPSPASVLANPTGATAYPIVGTTNGLFYTCYSSSKIAKLIGGKNGFLNWFYNNSVVIDPDHGLLAQAGFGALPKAWRHAITETFIKNTSGLGLTISAVGNGACTNGEVGG